MLPPDTADTLKAALIGIIGKDAYEQETNGKGGATMAQRQKNVEARKYKEQYVSYYTTNYGDLEFLAFLFNQPETSHDTKRHIANRFLYRVERNSSAINANVLLSIVDFLDSDKDRETIANILANGNVSDMNYALVVLKYAQDYYKKMTAKIVIEKWTYLAFSGDAKERVQLKELLQLIAETSEAEDKIKDAARGILKQMFQ